MKDVSGIGQKRTNLERLHNHQSTLHLQSQRQGKKSKRAGRLVQRR